MRIHFFWWKYPQEGDFSRYQFSNVELVKHGMVELSRYADVVFHHSNIRGRVTSDPDDLLLGHPPYPECHEDENWMFDNGLDGPGSVHPNTFVMYPFAVADEPAWTHFPLDTYCRISRAFFGMGGVAHYDYSLASAPADSLWRRIQPKFVRVNMGCDVRELPHKTDFKQRPPGLLHVSSLNSSKRPELMFRSLPKGTRLYLGTFATKLIDGFWRQGLIPEDMRLLPALDNGNPATNAMILKECSFYVHAAREPQATAILEACARGLVPILHPQSGFRSPYAIDLTFDPKENQEIIARALAMPEDEYAERSVGVRRQVQIWHSWQRIFMNIVADMRSLVAGEEVNRRGDDFS